MWEEKTSFFGTPRIPKTKSFSFKRFMLKSGPRAIVNKQFKKKKIMPLLWKIGKPSEYI